MNKEYIEYNAKITKHMIKYLEYNYKGFELNERHKYILDKSYPKEMSLLDSNRELFKSHIPASFIMHSKGNFKSSQIMALDYFLPFLEKKLGNVNEKLSIQDDIVHLEFEKLFEDDTEVDVFMKTSKNEKVLIEVKYRERRFDIVPANIRRSKKFKGEGVNYLNINKHMDGDLVTEEEFLGNYQLFRNVYNAFNDEHGLPGYFIALYPKMHPLLDTQFDQFYYDLKYKYKFKFIDRVRKIYWEDISSLNLAFKGKYLYLKDSRVNVRMELRDYWNSNESNQYKEYENIRMLKDNEIVKIDTDNLLEDIEDTMVRITNPHIKRIILISEESIGNIGPFFERLIDYYKEYDIVDFDRFIHKDYVNDIDLVILR